MNGQSIIKLLKISRQSLAVSRFIEIQLFKQYLHSTTKLSNIQSFLF